MKFRKVIARIFVLFLVCEFIPVALGQAPAPPAQQTPPPIVISPEVSADRLITFRLLAPQAEKRSAYGK